jgi:cbb3-type cytochrome oxidase maturation protein
MSVLYVLLAISIIVAVIFFIAFIVSVRTGQYDDTYTPSVRILFENELVKPYTETKNAHKIQESGTAKKNTIKKTETRR